MRETTTAVPPLAWSHRYPGHADHVGEARRFLASVLDGRTAAYDAILCLSELAANAVTHSNSGDPGGLFTVRASVCHGDRVRVEVEDQGGQWITPAFEDGQHGRGLLIVSQLASDWGISGDGQAGWIVWFEIACSLPRHPDRTLPQPMDVPSTGLGACERHIHGVADSGHARVAAG